MVDNINVTIADNQPINVEFTGFSQGGSGEATTASNGLNLVGVDVQLGGTLTGNITIDGDTSYELVLQNMDNVDLRGAATVQVGSTDDEFYLESAAGMFFSDSGAYYEFSPIPAAGTPTKALGMSAGDQMITFDVPTGESITASNGLTRTADDIELGGNLTKHTEIEGSGTYTFTINDAGNFDVTSDGNIDLVAGDELNLTSSAGMYINTGSSNCEIQGTVKSTLGRIINTTREAASTTLSGVHHNVIYDTDGGALNCNLPAGADGTQYIITNAGSSGNDVTINPNGAQLLRGVNSSLALADGETIMLIYETTEGWWGSVIAPAGGGGGASDTINAIGSTASNQDLDFDTDGTFVTMTLTGNITIDFTDLADTSTARTIYLQITQDPTGSRTVTWDGAGRSNILFPGSVEPVLSSGPNNVDYFEFQWNGSDFIFKNAIFDLQN